MELIDRYLHEVERLLPEGQRKDIVAELSEDLRSEIDAKEAELGRPLSEDELESVLRKRGHPLSVAERFLPESQLIGAVLLPQYWRVVKVAECCILAIFIGLYAAFGPFAQGAGLLRGLSESLYWLWMLCLYGFAYLGLFTLIFAWVERSRTRYKDNWDPRHPGRPPAAPTTEERQQRRKMRTTFVGEFASGLVFILWWVNELRLPALPAIQIALAPVIARLFWWPVLILAVAITASALVNAVWPWWTTRRAGARLLIDLFGLVVVSGLIVATLRNGSLVETNVAWTGHVLTQVWLIIFAFQWMSLAIRAVQDARRFTARTPMHNWAVTMLDGY